MVYWGLYAMAFIVATGATAAYLLVRRAIAPGTMTATATWAYLALQGQQVVIYHQDGSSTTVGEPYLQWVWAFLAILSLATFVLWQVEAYPPEDEARAADAADQSAAGEGLYGPGHP